MSLFRRKPDPITEQERDIKAEIAALESEIQRLSTTLNDPHALPEPSQSEQANPFGGDDKPQARKRAKRSRSSYRRSHEPIFEELSLHRTQAATEVDPAYFNDAGFRKWDPWTWFRKWRDHFRKPHPANPRLINYLAAGSIQGLRPLRYEKRIARRRFIALVICLFLVLWGLFTFISRP